LNTASIVSTQVVSLFIIMVIGYLSRAFGIIDRGSTKKLSKLLVYVTNPLLIIMAFQQAFSTQKLSIMLTVIGVSVVVHLLATVVALCMFRGKDIRESRVYRFCIIYANCGYMGYPLLQAVFPTNGLFYGACYVLFFNIYLWTFGVLLLTSGRKGNYVSLRKAFVNPGVIGAGIGFFLFITGISLPNVVASALGSTANLTFPLSMIILGSMLREVSLVEVFTNIDAYIVAFVKLLALPLTVLLGCVIFGVAEGTTYICVIMAATPVAAKAPIMAEVYGADKNKTLVCVELTTLLSVITIPIVMYITQLAF